MTTTSSTPVGSATITVTCACGSLSHVTSSALTAHPPPQSFDFSLSNGGNKTVVRGQSVSNTITATLVSGTPQSVSFSASGLPTGATASFSPGSCSPTCSPTVTLTTSASTPAGSSTITVTGLAGSLSHTSKFTLTVNATPPPTVSITSPVNGASVSGTITVSATASSNAAGVQFQLDGTNLGAEATASPCSVSWNSTTTSNGSHTLSAIARDS